MAADVRVEIGGAALARPLIDPICALYDEVFSAPPFFWREDESELHRERLLRLLDDPSFGVAVARAGEELVGFAYGVSTAAEHDSLGRPDRRDVAGAGGGVAGTDVPPVRLRDTGIKARAGHRPEGA